MDEKITNDSIIIELDAAQAHAVHKACQTRIMRLASNVSGEIIDFPKIEELGTLADALLIVSAAIVGDLRGDDTVCPA
jgi:hypothetical protein